jgi:hypothetical protein
LEDTNLYNEGLQGIPELEHGFTASCSDKYEADT